MCALLLVRALGEPGEVVNERVLLLREEAETGHVVQTVVRVEDSFFHLVP